MKIELIDYAIENAGTTGVFADLSIMAGEIGPIRWHIIPSKWNLQEWRVTFSTGIGAPSDDYDLSCLSTDDRLMLFGEQHNVEDIHNFEEKVEPALRERMNIIYKEMNFLEALDREHDQKLEVN